MEEKDIDLRGIADKGFVRFSIKAEDTPQNVAVHDAFREFSRVECNNDYTQALKRLLENYEEDGRFSLVWEKVQDLQGQIDALKKSVSGPKEVEEKGMF